MNKLIESIGNFASKCGLFPAVAILALIIGGYGCYAVQINANAIQKNRQLTSHDLSSLGREHGKVERVHGQIRRTFSPESARVAPELTCLIMSTDGTTYLL